MLRYAKSRAKRLLNFYPVWVCREEYKSQEFKRFNERPVEFGFVFRAMSTLYPRTVLDVGAGTTALTAWASDTHLSVQRNDLCKERLRTARLALWPGRSLHHAVVFTP